MNNYPILIFLILINSQTLVFSTQDQFVPNLEPNLLYDKVKPTHLCKKVKNEDDVAPTSKRQRVSSSSQTDRRKLQVFLDPITTIVTILQRKHTVYKITTKGTDHSGYDFLYENYFWFNKSGVDVRRSRNYRFWSPKAEDSYDRKKIRSLQHLHAIYNNDVIMVQYNLIRKLNPTLPKIIPLLSLTCLEVATPETVSLLNSCDGNYLTVLFQTSQGKVAKRLVDELGVVIAYRDIRWQDGILSIPVHQPSTKP